MLMERVKETQKMHVIGLFQPFFKRVQTSS